jgi:hypothetical protein
MKYHDQLWQPELWSAREVDATSATTSPLLMIGSPTTTTTIAEWKAAAAVNTAAHLLRILEEMARLCIC